MIWALDGYLIRRPAAAGHGSPNPFQDRQLRRRLVLDEYLIEARHLTGRIAGSAKELAKAGACVVLAGEAAGEEAEA